MRATTLDELFEGDGLDQNLVEQVQKAVKGLKAELIVKPMSVDSDDDPESYHVHVNLLWPPSDPKPSGEVGWLWHRDEPTVMHCVSLRIDSPLREAREPGAIGAYLIGFFRDELDIKEVIADGPNKAASTFAQKSVGWREVEQEDGSVALGGRIDEGPIAERVDEVRLS